jgi:hypothetical protein
MNPKESIMSLRNEGTVDRAIRIVVGIALLMFALVAKSFYIGLFGMIPLVTGIVGFCPVYRLIGVKTSGGSTPSSPSSA